MPVNFFHLTSAATDAAEAALNEAPSPVNDLSLIHISEPTRPY